MWKSWYTYDKVNVKYYDCFALFILCFASPKPCFAFWLVQKVVVKILAPLRTAARGCWWVLVAIILSNFWKAWCWEVNLAECFVTRRTCAGSSRSWFDQRDSVRVQFEYQRRTLYLVYIRFPLLSIQYYDMVAPFSLPMSLFWWYIYIYLFIWSLQVIWQVQSL